ncbi:hypothetical protein A2X44_02280 [candidate division CPR3 bacterium GWF2_35_18]|uniref:Uncharacterized protein n=1 Tax=candidate division CPR3 bacterium GW2011_GWF2_35_18 TaxID=1618350 RepID=A0A0G0E3W1_UNCC3|nr:MAG: hypothetical protein UR67_C0002G0140 [candidate division CPR3 bacterium GW2011_GWF2_35_18]KKP86258.1 MAG: hypothetical protein UR87_C0024G0002 [candidate division CPR3 bacterium GW2011_GWE2_35_7]OGB62824.1 MAG: hypothetical protein A2X44_02280 [candidate division CPR3 bacterium GWF2_35_18]OGB65405.1 MAG: hypothetical protein A2250_00495 [candidate division CPR3 bacterium RIFOXYA2_FULL_35_13]OGB76852.1 MAG: hypothetical protein A2476_04255 [candidate division CPR3 bacterium RIFOXYC2_FULL
MNKYEKLVKNFVQKANSGIRVSATKAIRMYCLDCMGYQYKEVDRCPSQLRCPLFHFRKGKNTTGISNTKKKVSEISLRNLSERKSKE